MNWVDLGVWDTLAQWVYPLTVLVMWAGSALAFAHATNGHRLAFALLGAGLAWGGLAFALLGVNAGRGFLALPEAMVVFRLLVTLGTVLGGLFIVFHLVWMWRRGRAEKVRG